MAGVITWNRLRELAALRAENGLAISLYIGFDPSVAATTPTAATKMNSLLDVAQRSTLADRGELTHDQKAGLQSDFERIRDFFANDFDRAGTQGLAVFAAGLDAFWSVNALSEPVPDRVCVGPDFYLRPLVPLLGRGQGAIVAVIDRERGLLFQLTNGRLEPLADLSEEQPGRHDQGGWSQARFQRHIDELARDHLRAVAVNLDGHVRRGLAKHIVVVGPEEARAGFTDMLAQETQSAFVGATAGEGYATPTELLELALPFLEQARAAEETAALERWQEEAGRSGRAASGWDADARSRLGRTGRAVAVPGRSRAPRVRVPLVRSCSDPERRVPARRDADGAAPGRRRPRRAPHARPRWLGARTRARAAGARSRRRHRRIASLLARFARSAGTSGD